MSDTNNLQSEIDRCVMCGMCSQYCPTYRLTPDENESPRGRIALINALEKGQLNPSDKLISHLEHCTYCRACENYCPSGVRFGLIMDAAKANIDQNHSRPKHEHYMQNVLAKPEKTRRLGRWLDRYQRWGFQRLIRASGLLSLTKYQQGDSLLPPLDDVSELPDELPEYSPPLGQLRGDVALFTGCVSSILDRQTLDASRRLLNVLGYGVYTPTGQTCCGAMHQHSGQPDQAIELARNNVAVFKTLDVEAIVHTSTGCTSFLKEYDQLPAWDKPQKKNAAAFSTQVQDVIHFVLNRPWPEDLSIRALAKPVAIHEPCSARNVLHQSQDVYQLLEKIPGIKSLPLPDNSQCCGASGSQLLTKSTFAERLRQNKLDNLAELSNDKQQAVTALVTSNIGCALHLAAGLREQGISIEVIHPVTLLMRQIELNKACTPVQTSAKVMT